MCSATWGWDGLLVEKRRHHDDWGGDSGLLPLPLLVLPLSSESGQLVVLRAHLPIAKD